ncbi:MAG: single-stranded DNA-binding protein, partial [Steroidobacteraceae bacterium]
LGEAIAKSARKGDQLIVEAKIRSNNWTDQQGDRQYDYSFIAESFRFGAPGKVKREEFDERREQAGGRATLTDAA